MRRVLKPAVRPLKGSVAVPGDKSIGHRALILGALADGGLRVRNLPAGEDVRSTRRCLEGVGVAVLEDRDGVVVQGEGLAAPWRGSEWDLDCGNSGTTMRLLMGALSGMPLESRLVGDASLSRRPMDRVAEPLVSMGAAVELTDGRAPVRVAGRRPLRGVRYALRVPSAQVKSAVLLAALSARGETVLDDPFGTRDHTERMLGWLNPSMLRREGSAITIRPDELKGGRALKVPGDLSSAAFFVAAAAILEGSEAALPGVGVNPTRMGFVEVLREMGAEIELANVREEGGEPVADLRARHAPLRSVVVRAERVPALIDEVPLLAVVAAAAKGRTRLEGLGELRLKESDRLEGAARALAAMGVAARIDGAALEIEGPARLRGAAVETLGDHRLAMAFAVAALAAKGETTLSDADCAAVSYPGFFEDLSRLAA